MGQVEYIDYEIQSVQPRTVNKQVWDGEKFVPMTLIRIPGIPTQEQETWLRNTFGWRGESKPGCFWDFSRAGDFSVFDQKVYAWYQLKWGNK